MSTLVVKNLPQELYDKLKQQAERNHRSVTKEIVSLIEASVAEQGSQAARAQPFEVRAVDELRQYLPDHLVRELKIRAAQLDRKLEDVTAEFIQHGLETASQQNTGDPLQALMRKLVFRADGSVTNPDGIDDPAFFDALDDIRRRSRASEPRNPFDHGAAD